MAQAVGIRFRSAGKVYDFDPAGISLRFGEQVVVLTVHGQELGWVAREEREVTPDAPLRPVVRQADYEDVELYAKMKDKAAQSFDVALEQVDRLALDMDLVDCEYTLDGHHLTFYFTAEGRVDFRELVRELNARFPCRVELRQIGVRDEAKILGGLGMCGRPMCCTTFLTEFQSVSIRMVKEQGLSLNPGRITGNCGRLLCCLRFEHPDQLKAVPAVGD